MNEPVKKPIRLTKRGKIIAAIAISSVVLFAGRSYLLHRGSETTDDAFIESHVMQVSSKIPEKVARVHVSDNQMVEAGQLLVELETRDTQALVNQARANLVSSEAKLDQARAQAEAEQSSQAQCQADVGEAKATSDNAEQELERAKSLRKSGAISQREFDQTLAKALSTKSALASKQQKACGAESGVKVAQASVASAKAMVDQSKALLDMAELRLSNTKIFAPEAGRVTRKNVEPGNYVHAGTPLMAVVSPQVWVVANFKETQLASMREGQSAEVEVDSYPGLRIPGRIDSIQAGTGSRFSLLPPENATGNYVKVVQRVPVKIALEIPPDAPLLAPGMSVSPTVRVR